MFQLFIRRTLQENSRVFLLRQIWIVKYSLKYSLKYSTVDYNYLLFLQDFFFGLKPKQYKKCHYCRLSKKNLETNKLFDGINDVIFDGPF